MLFAPPTHTPNEYWDPLCALSTQSLGPGLGFLALWFPVEFGQWEALAGEWRMGGERGQGISSHCCLLYIRWLWQEVFAHQL